MIVHEIPQSRLTLMADHLQVPRESGGPYGRFVFELCPLVGGRDIDMVMQLVLVGPPGDKTKLPVFPDNKLNLSRFCLQRSLRPNERLGTRFCIYN